MTRRLSYLAYYGLARHLPESTKPYAWGARRLRGLLARRLLASCGSDVTIEHGADFGSGARVTLGDRSGIGTSCRLVGEVRIGRDVLMGPEVYVTSMNHRMLPGAPMIDQGMTGNDPVTIEDDVWIGARAILLPGVTIGRGAVVGAGAVVPRDVPPFAVVVGNPARVVRSRHVSGDLEPSQATPQLPAEEQVR